MLHHLRENEIRELTSMTQQDVFDLGIRIEVGADTGNHLAGQLIEEVGMGVVVDLIAFNEIADEIVLHARPSRGSSIVLAR